MSLMGNENKDSISCVHEPKLIQRKFDAGSNRICVFDLCKECSSLMPFNKFILSEILIKKEGYN